MEIPAGFREFLEKKGGGLDTLTEFLQQRCGTVKEEDERGLQVTVGTLHLTLELVGVADGVDGIWNQKARLDIGLAINGGFTVDGLDFEHDTPYDF